MVKIRETQIENKKRHSSNDLNHHRRQQHYSQNNLMTDMDGEIDDDDRIILNSSTNFKSIPEQLGDILASNEIGQYIIVKLHKILWILENTTKWSCPGIAEKNLIRPLPWILFLPTIVFMQFIRTGLSVMSHLKAMITRFDTDNHNTSVTMPNKMVHTMQVWRRHLRSLRYEGIRTIQKRNEAVTNFINSFKELLNNCIYTPPILVRSKSKSEEVKICDDNVEIKNTDVSNKLVDDGSNVSDDEEENEALEVLQKLLNTTIAEDDLNSDEDKTFQLNDLDYSGDESIASSAYESLNEANHITETQTKKRRHRRRNRRNSKANKENIQPEKLQIDLPGQQSMNSQNDGDDVDSNCGGSLSILEPTSSGFNSTDQTTDIRAYELSSSIADEMNTSPGNENSNEENIINNLHMKNSSSSMNGDIDNSDIILNIDNYDYGNNNEEEEDEEEVDEYHQSSEDSEFYNKENESTYKSLNDSLNCRMPNSSLSPTSPNTSVVDQFYKETN